MIYPLIPVIKMSPVIKIFKVNVSFSIPVFTTTSKNMNAASVFTPLSSELRSQLDITMTTDEYTHTTATKMVLSLSTLQLRRSIVLQPPQKNAKNISLHGKKFRAFQLYYDVDKALCNHLILAIPCNFLQEIKDTILGLGQVTCLQIITNLRENYVKITQDDLEYNK